MNAPVFFDMDEGEDRQPRREGPRFKLGGEQFQCVPEAPGGAIYDVMALTTRDASGRRYHSLPDLMSFFELVLIDEREVDQGEDGEVPVMVTEPADDVARFHALMRDKSRPVRMERLSELAGNLIAHYTTRPT